MRALGLTVAICGLISGCMHSGARQEMAAKNSWVGKSVEELIQAYGYPARKHTSPRGHEVYEYQDSAVQAGATRSISFSSLQEADARGKVVRDACVRWFEIESGKVVQVNSRGCEG